MKLLVVNNTDAGLGDAALYDFIRMASRVDDEIVIRNIATGSDFHDCLADARRFDRVVVSGGDGTVSSACYELRYSDVPILIFPSGTANLVSQNIMHPTEIPALAALLHDGAIMNFDLGEFDFGEERLGFMMMAGCGFDERIMSSAQQHKERLGALAYLRAAFDNATPPVSRIRLTVDGKTTDTEGVGVVCMNFSKVQFDVNFGLANLPCDGLLDVCVLASQTAWDLLLPAVGAAIDHTGKALEQSHVLQYFRGMEIHVEAEPAMYVERDGDPTLFTTPFSVRVLPAATKLVVSQACIEEFGAE